MNKKDHITCKSPNNLVVKNIIGKKNPIKSDMLVRFFSKISQ